MTSDSPRLTDSLHAVDSREDPLVSKTLTHLQDCLSDVGGWLSSAQEMETTMLCIWQGQDDDYRKWDKNFGYPVAPFDGSADTRVRYVDASVEELVMLEMTAFFAAQPQAIQMGADDSRTAGKVGMLLKYEIQQRLASELWREFNLLCAWKHTFGHAVMHVGYSQCWTNGKRSLTQEELLAFMIERRMESLPEGSTEDESTALLVEEEMAQTLADMMLDQDSAQMAIELVQMRYPTLSPARARRVAKDLIQDGTAEFRIPVRKSGKPKVKAYCPGVDLFYDWWIDDIRRADVVHLVDCYTETEIRAMRLAEGWDEDFIDALLSMAPTPVVDNATMAKTDKIHTAARRMFDNTSTRSLRRRTSELMGSYQVLRSFVRSVDEDGIPQMHEIVSHPCVSGDGKNPLVGVNRLVDYYNDSGSCFVDFRREYKTRSNWESRGAPELAGGTQWELKKMRDGRINRNDLATNPPVRTSMRKEPGKAPRLGIAPGHLVIDGMQGETKYMQPPAFDEGTLEMENAIRADAANLLGLSHPNVPEAKQRMHQQWLVNNFLMGARDVVLLILSVDQQYMDPLLVSRVVGGSGEQSFAVTREEIAGQFDVLLKFDVNSNNMDFITARWGVIQQAYANDRSGVMNDEVITKWLLNSIDPNLADLAIGDAKQVAEDEVSEEKRELAIAAMKVVLPPRKVRNPESRLQAIQEVLQTNPTLGPMFQEDAQYRAIVEARAKKYQFDVDQKKNAEIGREGYQEPEMMTEA